MTLQPVLLCHMRCACVGSTLSPLADMDNGVCLQCPTRNTLSILKLSAEAGLPSAAGSNSWLTTFDLMTGHRHTLHVCETQGAGSLHLNPGVHTGLVKQVQAQQPPRHFTSAHDVVTDNTKVLLIILQRLQGHTVQQSRPLGGGFSRLRRLNQQLSNHLPHLWGSQAGMAPVRLHPSEPLKLRQGWGLSGTCSLFV
mmetsp:Transcript_88531/g.214610  ORF Transcript_88531/g.214610 Transcript_88531/m.214610 type:complete len:196 (-) Transcript_88531:399-986(-)